MNIEHQIEFNGTHPVTLVVNVAESMGIRDQRGQRSRMLLTHDVLGDLIKRLPRDTPITVLTVSNYAVTQCCVRTYGVQARAALLLAQAHSPHRSAVGHALEWATHGDPADYAHGEHPNETVIVVTDGSPADLARWQAYSLLNVWRGEPLSVIALGVGGFNASDLLVPGQRRAVAAELEHVNFLIRTDTGSNRPRIDTVPPSLSPPSSPPHVPNAIFGEEPISPPAAIRMLTVHDALGITHEHARQARIEHGDGYDIGPEPIALEVRADAKRAFDVITGGPTELNLVREGAKPPAVPTDTEHPRVYDAIELGERMTTHDGGTEYVDVERHGVLLLVNDPPAAPPPDPAAPPADPDPTE